MKYILHLTAYHYLKRGWLSGETMLEWVKGKNLYLPFIDNFPKNFISMFNMYHRLKVIRILLQIDHLLIFLTGCALI